MADYRLSSGLRGKGGMLVLAALSGLISSCGKEKLSDKAGEKMQDFIVSISTYARGLDPDFIVVPQNGPELAFAYLDPDDGLDPAYMEAVDGFGNEEVFYDGTLNIDPERLAMLQLLRPFKPVLVADYVTDDNNVPDVIARNQAEGFLSFPRTSDNYDYIKIPALIVDENDQDISTLAEVRNYLYLISTDNFSTKEDMLAALAVTNFDLLILDLFFDDEALTLAETSALKTKANGGRRLVISYINVGAAENYRYYWNEDWKLHRPNWLKKPYEGYEDEIWVKFWREEWREIIYGNDGSYIKKIVDAGFDGAYFDNVEGYYFLYFD